MSYDSPTRVLLDVSGSQVGTPGNPFFVSGSCPAPVVNVTNVINTGTVIDVGVSGSFVLLTPTGSIPNGVAHSLIRELTHLDDADGPRGDQWPSGLVKDTDTASSFPSGSIWWTDSGRTMKVAEVSVTRNASQLPIVIQWKAYASDGVSVAESYTDTITYQGVIEKTRTRTKP